MEPGEILKQLDRSDGRFAREAVEAAAQCRDEIVPELLRILEDLLEHAEGLDEEGDSRAHLYAMLLLAQFRETRAYPLVVRIAALPGDLLESLFGDFVTESFGKVMASVYDGDLGPIQRLIENRDASEYARGAAVSSLVTLAVEERAERGAVVGYFRELFRGRLPREEFEPWNQLVSAACDLHPGELMAEIEAAYDDELVDPSYVSWEDVQHCFGMGRKRAIAETLGNSHHRLVRDVAEEMGWWACFQENGDQVSQGATGTGSTGGTYDSPAFAATSTIRKPPKVGRNDPCPCGSGKKYKKCCGG